MRTYYRKQVKNDDKKIKSKCIDNYDCMAREKVFTDFKTSNRLTKDWKYPESIYKKNL